MNFKYLKSYKIFEGKVKKAKLQNISIKKYAYEKYQELFENKEELYKNNFQNLVNQYDDKQRAQEEFDWFYNKLVKLDSGGYIYRIMFLPDLKYLNNDDLGSCWTVDKENALSLVNNLYDMLEIDDEEYDKEDYKTYLIEAKTEPNNIDFDSSIAQFCELPNEQEVNLIDNTKLKMISIEKI